MKTRSVSTRWLRSILPLVFGIGVAGVSVGGSEGVGNIFARQFLDDGVKMEIPKMVYDPELQMMVDPYNGRPVYEENKEFKMAKVTAGCDDCPKYDEP